MPSYKEIRSQGCAKSRLLGCKCTPFCYAEKKASRTAFADLLMGANAPPFAMPRSLDS